MQAQPTRSGEQQRFRRAAAKVLHYPTRICRSLPILTFRLTLH
jgi:hypothetical protein